MDHDAMKCPRCGASYFSPCALEAGVVYRCNQRRHMDHIEEEGGDPYDGQPGAILEAQADLFI